MSKEQTDWVMVPREATSEMCRAQPDNASTDDVAFYRSKWRAMLSAAPVPPEAQAVAWLLSHPVHGERLSQHPITDGDRSLGWADTPLYQSPSPAGGVQGVAGTDLCAAFEHEVTQQTQAYRFKAGSKPGTWLFACDEWIDLSAILSALTAALSSQAQTTGGVE